MSSDLRRPAGPVDSTAFNSDQRSGLILPKIFGIGFHKTGTSSLTAALRHLGYRVTGPNGIDNPDIARDVLDLVHSLVPQYDAFQDNPWPILYRELDEHYPGSKFILTMRPADEWIQSVVRHFGRGRTPMREWIYGVGCPVGNEEIYLARYKRHNREVLEYFRDRPEDLLVLRITEGDGWDGLGKFLGRTVPEGSFPHVNKATVRERHMGKRRRRNRDFLRRAYRWLRKRLTS